MSSGCSMLAITRSRPPQRAHRSISMPNTRLSRAAQVMATCRGIARSPVPARLPAPDLRPAARTKTPPLAAECDQLLGVAVRAAHAQEAVLEAAAF